MTIGKWIIVAFILFASFIATLVTVCMRQDISLVSKNYYKEELQYQERIAQENNTASLTQKPSIVIRKNQLEVSFHDNKPDSGTLILFCPANEKMDRRYDLSKATEAVSQFDLEGLQKGMYRAKLQWTTRGKQHYQEEIIYL
ncbi:FixH family protein [Pseudochryseolinea flava]|nr:FixH family protein [Pseudochryseolinea flava]